LHIYVLLFFAIGCVLFYTIERQWGKIGVLPFLFLIAISPAMHYAVNTFTFTIRLALSEYAAMILNTAGIPVQNHGNYFVMADGQNFSVDTACIGLNMFNTGLCLVVLMLGFAEQKYKNKISVFKMGSVFFITVLLLVLTNLFRILGIVMFRAMPGTWSHELIGLFSLVFYMALPVYFLIKILFKRLPQAPEIKPVQALPDSFLRNGLSGAALCLLLLISNKWVQTIKQQVVKDEKLSRLELSGFTKQVLEDGVVEYRKDSILIYIKPANKVYESDHPPNMCWQGSGFGLEDVTRQYIGKYEILTATLRKKSLVQYTAWWYDNGECKTASQWEWRTSGGEPFRTINITTTNKQELEKLCKEYLNKKLF
ncbi:MAG: exosortase N, partial [Bacteroidia bacterium]|nr:exosortase N [Bacteroidia bacterium]